MSVLACFSMPRPVKITGRISSITNAFVNAVIPVIVPSIEEIEKALAILGMEPGDVRCAYCGDRATEWDHLRPLVLKRRPTGFISEIANLVPACGKCNQSKGNKPWRDWIVSAAKLSPKGRGVEGIEERTTRLEEYERWQLPTKGDFGSIVGAAEWEQYWDLCEAVNEELRQAQVVAETLRVRIVEAIKKQRSTR